ncbi:hypothetical protein QYE76_059160 [Lolium multiflorum]|uniref:DUF4218 domain-containing protein n=1 Tax=Lolium multiflorum TaxID=4521 RepID=A0AAD8QJ33_LOLMU|nr:hypothetical protein QYE76_059160 [Lolium multiflorum]
MPTARVYADGQMSGPSAYGLAGPARDDDRRRLRTVGVHVPMPRAAVGVYLALGVGSSMVPVPSASSLPSHGVSGGCEVPRPPFIILPHVDASPLAYSASTSAFLCRFPALLSLLYVSPMSTAPGLSLRHCAMNCSSASVVSIRAETAALHPNVAESVFHTCLNIPGKSKDNVKARVDVEILCDREKLHMKRPIGRQKNWFKPHANFCLDSIQKKEAFRWLKYVVMFPDGYCLNMSKGVNLSTGKVTGLKSHDYHIWIQRLMPVMLRGYIPEKVWRVLAQLSHFFRTLCAKQICPKVIAKLQHTVPELLCNLEMIFPPGFFTPMAHLIVHLANEALLGGPVQFRWQFCIEREFKYIRKITGNKAKIEACIAEAICLREMADAATTYYPDDVPTQHNPVTRYNVDVPENDPKLKLFQFPGGKAGKGTKYKLENEEKDCIMLYVLMNMEEVIPFVSREVTKYEKYDVNGFRFHTETHQKGRANPKTINTGVFTKGANNFDYYGRLQSVYELTFNQPFVQEDLGNDAETRGESVVDLKDISMLKKLLEANDNYDEPPPIDPSTLYSQDSDSDSGPEKEKEKEKEMEYESERESDDGW